MKTYLIQNSELRAERKKEFSELMSHPEVKKFIKSVLGARVIKASSYRVTYKIKRDAKGLDYIMKNRKKLFLKDIHKSRQIKL